MGKGDARRPMDGDKFRANYDSIFPRKRIAPPTEIHTDKKKEASKRACRDNFQN